MSLTQLAERARLKIPLDVPLPNSGLTIRIYRPRAIRYENAEGEVRACLVGGLSIRQTAAHLGVAVSTAALWRRRARGS
jgi:transposase